jgi:hypothetical protein
MNPTNHWKLCVSYTEWFYILWDFRAPYHVLSTNNVDNNERNYYNLLFKNCILISSLVLDIKNFVCVFVYVWVCVCVLYVCTSVGKNYVHKSTNLQDRIISLLSLCDYIIQLRRLILNIWRYSMSAFCVKRNVERKTKKTISPIKVSHFQSPKNGKCSTFDVVGFIKRISWVNLKNILPFSSILPNKCTEDERICNKFHSFFGT